ncbi:restriction endonuclease subunit S [Bombella intestini]|uniref:restriction endonuclease subunit S n=1 Tax=Bombella intestini TaxID=1539051 RepID=UPI000987ACE1|nr:restriction endonuclease subunit S [Bombella intestini]
MNGLPRGWVEALVGDLVSLKSKKVDPRSVPDRPFIGLNDIEPHTSKLSYIGRASDVKSSVVCFEVGDILYSRLRPYLNKVICPNFTGVASSEILVLEPKYGVYSDFIRINIMTKSFLNFVSVHNKGDRPRVNYKDIAKFCLFLPPLPEQQRIVVKINSLTDKSRRARNHLDRISFLVKKYKEAVLSAAFSGHLTDKWRKIRGLPVSCGVRLGDVVERFSYGSSAKSLPEGRVPVLRMGNIQDGELDWEKLVFTDDPIEIKKYRLKKGDVLFNRTNSPVLVGKTACFDGGREAIYAGYIIKIQCKEELFPEFLSYCLNSPYGRAYSWRVKTGSVNQANINAKKLAEFYFELPSVEEQKEIVRRIKSAFAWIDHIVVTTTSVSKLVEQLDQAVLSKAFRGELVPQDPNDEPASILLERIRAERAAAPQPKRGRRKKA